MARPAHVLTLRAQAVCLVAALAARLLTTLAWTLTLSVMKSCLLLALTLVVLSACETAPVLQTQSESLKAVRRDGYFAVVRFLDDDTLKERYGARYNPFVARPRTFTPTSFLVFKINIEEVRRPLFLQLNKMELRFGEKVASPVDLYNMNLYWQFEDPDTDITQIEKDKRDQILREELLAYEQLVPIGARVSKLIVFRANFPRIGDAKLTIPLLDDKRQPVDKLEFTFTF